MDPVTVLARGEQTPYRVILDDGQHQWIADEPTTVGGGGTGPDPMELLCSSLGACTAITVRMYAARKGWPLESIQVRITMNPDGEVKGETVLARTLMLEGPLDQTQRERLLQIANACPTHKILTGTVRIPTDEG